MPWKNKYSITQVMVLKLITLLVTVILWSCMEFKHSYKIEEPYKQYLFNDLYHLKKLVLTF